MKKSVFICVLVMLCAMLVSCGRQPFRLHVVANSDSAADQTVKLKVRDAVIEELYEMEQVSSAEEAAEAAAARMDDIIAAADKVLEENGMEYRAAAEIGVFPFPDKEYGGKVYPAGDYPALRIVLGEGAGQNWWCVLFPPLCIVNTESETGEELEVRSAFWDWITGIAK